MEVIPTLDIKAGDSVLFRGHGVHEAKIVLGANVSISRINGSHEGNTEEGVWRGPSWVAVYRSGQLGDFMMYGSCGPASGDFGTRGVFIPYSNQFPNTLGPGEWTMLANIYGTGSVAIQFGSAADPEPVVVTALSETVWIEANYFADFTKESAPAPYSVFYNEKIEAIAPSLLITSFMVQSSIPYVYPQEMTNVIGRTSGGECVRKTQTVFPLGGNTFFESDTSAFLAAGPYKWTGTFRAGAAADGMAGESGPRPLAWAELIGFKLPE